MLQVGRRKRLLSWTIRKEDSCCQTLWRCEVRLSPLGRMRKIGVQNEVKTALSGHGEIEVSVRVSPLVFAKRRRSAKYDACNAIVQGSLDCITLGYHRTDKCLFP